MSYTAHDLYQSVNDIYTQIENGQISEYDASIILRRCCAQFLADNQEQAK